jgi:hypothetical protein
MTKLAANPFDSFPLDGTPVDFWHCALPALNLLEPYLNDNDVHHQMYVKLCVAYSQMIFGDPEHPDQEEDWELLIMRQRQMVTVFKKIWDGIVATDAVAKVKKQSQAQSKRASEQNKVSASAQQRIVKHYLEKQASGSVYGVIKDLARDCDVTPTAIHAILRKHGVEPLTKQRKNSIDK